MATSNRKLPWSTHSIDDLPLTIAVFSDKAQLVHTSANGLVTLIHSHDPARIALWIGEGQSIDTWRARLTSRGPVTLEREAAVQVCGLAARKQTALVPEAPAAIGLVQDPDGTLSHIEQAFPATVHVAVAFLVGDTPVVMSWMIPASDRDAYAADEAHFFASVRCSSGSP